MIGRDVTAYNRGQHVERTTWIGKPWRRLELLIQDFFYKGERFDRQWTFSVSLGSVRLGWHFNASLTRAVGFDYSDEPNQ